MSSDHNHFSSVESLFVGNVSRLKSTSDENKKQSFKKKDEFEKKSILSHKITVDILLTGSKN